MTFRFKQIHDHSSFSVAGRMEDFIWETFILRRFENRKTSSCFSISFYCLWWDVSNIERIKLNLDLIRNQYWRLRIKKISGSLSRSRFAALRKGWGNFLFAYE